MNKFTKMLNILEDMGYDKLIKFAKVVNPPRKWFVYLKNNAKKLEKYASLLAELSVDVVAKYEENSNFELFIDDTIKNGGDLNRTPILILSKVCDEIRGVLRYLFKAYESNASNKYSELEGSVKLLKSRFDLKFIDDYLFKYKDALEENFGEYNTDKNKKEYLDLIKKMTSLFQDIAKFIPELQSKINEEYRLQKMDLEYKPDPDKVEKLYHATIHADDIIKNWFKKEVPDDRRGLGLGDSDKISFTTDLYIARDILRVLKEVIMIANGDLKWDDIRKWYISEGLDPKTAYDEGTIHNYPPENSEEVFEYYTHYFWVSKLRRNPVISSGIRGDALRQYKNKNVKDAGILECDIDMTTKGITYHAPEREYRVPVEAVLSMKRIQ